MPKHPDFDKLPNYEDVTDYKELICPFLSNEEELVNCLSQNCAYYRNCFKEMNYNESLVKFFRYFVMTILSLICISILLLRI